ncbi:hypothetical protein, partial [Acinetobacter baumannii]|uniref:hypothetical protein n=1 Tax=Acinetobacter baumannii TaxID=470 RepID=UPI001969EB5C
MIFALSSAYEGDICRVPVRFWGWANFLSDGKMVMGTKKDDPYLYRSHLLMYQLLFVRYVSH